MSGCYSLYKTEFFIKPSFALHAARERRQSGSSLGPAQREPKEKQNIMAQRVLVPGQDAEAALADALVSNSKSSGGQCPVAWMRVDGPGSIEPKLKTI